MTYREWYWYFRLRHHFTPFDAAWSAVWMFKESATWLL